MVQSTMRSMTRSADSFYVRDCQKIQSGTVEVQNLAGQISRQIHLAESEKDLSDIQEMIDRAVADCADIQLLLKRFQEYTELGSIPECMSRKMMQRTLNDNVSVTARVLEDIIQNFLTLCKERQPGPLIDMANDSEESNAGLADRVRHDGVTVEYLDQQRLDSISKVESDMIALKQIYTDLNKTASTQQEYFDSIESHLLESGTYTQSAVNEFLISDARVGDKWKRRYKGAALVVGVLVALYFFVLAPT